MAPPTFSLAHALLETNSIQDILYVEDNELLFNDLNDMPLLDNIGVDDNLEHPLNNILGIDDIPPDPPTLPCPLKCGILLPAEIICHLKANVELPLPTAFSRYAAKPRSKDSDED